jgi:methionyl-tRNA formyltransferase
MLNESPIAIYSMNSIVFFGTEDFSLLTLKALVEANFSVSAVVTKPDSPKGRGHQMSEPLVKTFAKQHDIPVMQPVKLSEISEEIKKLDNPIGILVSYGKIIPQSVLDLFHPGIINVHPSLLPKYRGPSPIETAILNGDEETGVSIMQLSAQMDAGPVYAQQTVSLSGTETVDQLYDQLGTLGSQMLIEALPTISDGSLQPTTQQDDAASYCHIIKKDDGIIDWHKSAEQIEREIRAYKGWPQSRTTFGNVDVIITKAEVITDQGNPGQIENRGNELIAYTSGGALRVLELKPLGKKEMPISAFLLGYQSQL